MMDAVEKALGARALEPIPGKTAVRDVIRRHQPAVLSGHARTRNVLEHLSLDDCVIRYDTRNGLYANYDAQHNYPVPLSTALRECRDDTFRHVYYIRQIPLPAPDLLPIPGVGDDCILGGSLLVGWDTYTRLHYHSTSNSFLRQVSGRKALFVFSPRQHDLMYPYPWHTNRSTFSRVDFTGNYQEVYPRFSGAHGMRCTLEPGDVAFIPAGWWHAALGLGQSISIVTFTQSSIFRLPYPDPGIRILADVAYSRLRRWACVAVNGLRAKQDRAHCG